MDVFSAIYSFSKFLFFDSWDIQRRDWDFASDKTVPYLFDRSFLFV